MARRRSASGKEEGGYGKRRGGRTESSPRHERSRTSSRDHGRTIPPVGVTFLATAMPVAEGVPPAGKKRAADWGDVKSPLF